MRMDISLMDALLMGNLQLGGSATPDGLAALRLSSTVSWWRGSLVARRLGCLATWLGGKHSDSVASSDAQASGAVGSDLDMVACDD